MNEHTPTPLTFGYVLRAAFDAGVVAAAEANRVLFTPDYQDTLDRNWAEFREALADPDARPTTACYWCMGKGTKTARTNDPYPGAMETIECLDCDGTGKAHR